VTCRTSAAGNAEAMDADGLEDADLDATLAAVTGAV
jgi:hypothetical protein